MISLDLLLKWKVVMNIINKTKTHQQNSFLGNGHTNRTETQNQQSSFKSNITKTLFNNFSFHHS